MKSWPDKACKDTVVNRTLQCINGESIEITSMQFL